LTPLLLLSVNRSFDYPFSAGSIALGSVALAVSILGAHIEGLIIQFLLVILFVIFEATVARGRSRIRGVATWLTTVLLGFGLVAFFLFPVLEYLTHAQLGHSGGVGANSLATDGEPMIWILTLFVPYFFGFLQTYPYQGLRQVFFWDILPTYVGTTVFFLASVALFSISKPRKGQNWSYSVFFIVSAFLILLKIFGVPPINWIGYLPVLDHVIFTRFSGSVLAMSFSGACAFGLEKVAAGSSAAWNLKRAALLPFLVTVLAALATIPSPASPSNLYFAVSAAYLILALFFLFWSYRMASISGINAAKTLAFLVILELACYIPRSLSVVYEAARVAVCAGAALTIALHSYKPKLFTLSSLARLISPLRKLSRERTFTLLLVMALLFQSVIAAVSPWGLPNRYDAFAEAPYVNFLKKNIGNQRVYSFDGVMFPPVAGVFSIQHLGEFSAFMPQSFRAFSQANLDRAAPSSVLAGNAWMRAESPSPTSEIRSNLAFYSLLGVKYFVTLYSDLNIAYEILLRPEIEGDHSWMQLGNRSISTQFVTDTSFNTILVRLETHNLVYRGEVTLILDSIPYNESLHRESRIRNESIRDYAHSTFSFSDVRITHKTEFRVTLLQSDKVEGNEVSVMHWPKVKHEPKLTISSGFLNIALGIALRDEFLPIVFHDQNATIYQNVRVFPRAFLVNNVEMVGNQEEAVLRTRDLGWSSRDIVVLEADSRTATPKTNASKIRNTLSQAEIEKYTPSEVRIRVETDTSSFLVLTDTFYPGWKAYVNGEPATVHRAYGVSRAVFVPAGSHRVLFRYEPESFDVGLALTCASSLVLVITMVIRVVKNRR
nr:YfhO family protein [Candidatus Njordarchaeum guaymaensis]